MNLQIIFFLSLFPILTFGQNSSSQDSTKYSPKYFLDSVEINIQKTFLDGSNISLINATRPEEDTVYTTHRIKHIYLTQKEKHQLVALSQINLGNLSCISKNKKYLLDDSLLLDTTDIRIELSIIKKINIRCDDTSPSNQHDPTTTYIYITTTRPKKNFR